MSLDGEDRHRSRWGRRFAIVFCTACCILAWIVIIAMVVALQPRPG